MKKSSLILIFVLTLGFTKAQVITFSQYFVAKTLRINYLHQGNSATDTILFSKAHSYASWAGTTTQMIDPFIYGANRVELYDSLSNKLIYSRGYSNLFEEWRTTAEGKIKTETFEEVVLVPMPKKRPKLFSNEENAVVDLPKFHIFTSTQKRQPLLPLKKKKPL